MELHTLLLALGFGIGAGKLTLAASLAALVVGGVWWSADDTVKRLVANGLLDVNGYGFVEVLTQTVLFSDFTDGGAAVGTKVLAKAIPAGSIMLGSKLVVNTGFTGDVSATLTVGDGSTVDRYNTGTPSVFATAAAGVQSGVPSGTKLLTAANKPTLTVTSNADFTAVVAGSLTLSLYYIRTQ
jgi:hypothetical protein